MNDPSRLFSEAEQEFRLSRWDRCVALLHQVSAIVGPHAQVQHLLALAEGKRARRTEARRAFETALGLAPTDRTILNNFGNFLLNNDAVAEAVARFDTLHAMHPDFVEGAFNRALALTAAGAFVRARTALIDLESKASTTARYWSARGNVAYSLGMLDEGAACYDRALAIAPDHGRALHGRGRIALERGEDEAPALLARASAAAPDDPEILLGHIESLAHRNDPTAWSILDEAIRNRPDWIDGRLLGLRLAWESHERERFDTRLAAIADLPHRTPDLLLTTAATLSGVDLFYKAAQFARQCLTAFPDDVVALQLLAEASWRDGDRDSARQAYHRLDELGALPSNQRAIHAIREGRLEEAERHLDDLCRLEPDNVGAWALRDFVWRLLDDDRHHWLHGQPGLYALKPLPIDGDEIRHLADYIKSLHTSSAFPIGQSLRGGTQTRGNILMRKEPESARIRQLLQDAVVAHWNALPPRDDSHPLLKHRDGRPRIRGSWSVRLEGSGFHVSHIHPHGLLSSASYWIVPPPAGPDDWSGTLELGRPPDDLGLDLPPMTTLRPAPGMLALFPSTLMHGTRPFAAGERLTLPIDVDLLPEGL